MSSGVPVFGALLVLLGLWLVRRGHWPRRVGHERFCRRCNYQLHSDVRTECSECGEPVTTARIGSRQRNDTFVLVGLALIVVAVLVAGADVAHRCRVIDFYTRAPLWWVLRDMGSASNPQAYKGWTEIRRRLGAGQLSTAARARVGRAIAHEFAKQTPGPLWNLCRGELEPSAGGLVDPSLAEPIRSLALPRAMRGTSQHDLWFAYWLSAASQLHLLDRGERLALFKRYVVLDTQYPSTDEYAQMAIRHMLTKNAIDDESRQAAVDIALRRLADPRRPHNYNDNHWCIWLNECWRRGELTPEQQDTLLTEMHGVRVLLPNRVPAGNPIPYRFWQCGRFYSDDGWINFKQIRLLVAGQIMRELHPWSGGGASGMETRGELKPLPVGLHSIACEIDFDVYRGALRDFDRSILLGSFKRRIVIPIEVIAPAAAEHVGLSGPEGRQGTLTGDARE